MKDMKDMEKMEEGVGAIYIHTEMCLLGHVSVSGHVVRGT